MVVALVLALSLGSIQFPVTGGKPAGREALAKIPGLDKVTPRERAWVDAIRVLYEIVLAEHPNLAGAMLIAAKAARDVGDAARARELFQRVASLWANADPDFKPLAEVKAALGAGR